MLPDFIFIGPGKAATTWVYHVLREHPEIGVPKTKDIQYFDRYFERGQRWYESHFAGLSGRVVGEVSTRYFSNEEAPERMAVVLPEAKLICCLRNPVDRSLSDYHYRLGTGEIDLSLEQAITSTDIVACSLYGQSLQRYAGFVRRGRMKVMLYDELLADPARFVTELFEFLGVNPHFRPSCMNTVVRPEGQARSRAIGRLVHRGANIAKDLGFYGVVTTLKRNPAIARLLYRDQRYVVTRRERELLAPHFRADLALLESEFGLKLPEGWKE